jgi:hypothetical protein
MLIENCRLDFGIPWNVGDFAVPKSYKIYPSFFLALKEKPILENKKLVRYFTITKDNGVRNISNVKRGEKMTAGKYSITAG